VDWPPSRLLVSCPCDLRRPVQPLAAELTSGSAAAVTRWAGLPHYYFPARSPGGRTRYRSTACLHGTIVTFRTYVSTRASEAAVTAGKAGDRNDGAGSRHQFSRPGASYAAPHERPDDPVALCLPALDPVGKPVPGDGAEPQDWPAAIVGVAHENVAVMADGPFAQESARI
jgi:hypothetical protein